MSTFNLPIESVTKETIQSLINNVSESTQIDFKKKLNLNKDEEKKEFLADVVSFASTSGGDIIIGISENKGIAEKIEPIEIPDIDNFKLSVSSIIKDGIEPRVNFQIKEFLFDKEYVILLRIFKLFPGPPMIIYKNTSKFFGRGASGKYQLNYLQIRNAFTSAATINETFKEFRNNRINHFLSGVDGNDPSKPFMLFYIYPINEVNFDINNIPVEKINEALYPVTSGSFDKTYNIEGFAMYRHIKHDGDNRLTQNQLFYNSAIEIYDDNFLNNKKISNKSNIKLVYLDYLEGHIIRNFERIIKFYSKYSISAPYLINFSLVSIRNSQGATHDLKHNYSFKIINRENLIFREFVINPNTDYPVDSLKLMFDDLWRSFGVFKSPSFDEDGKFLKSS